MGQFDALSPFDARSPAFIELFHITGDFPAGEAPPRWKGPAPVLRFLIIQNMETAVDPLEISPAAWHQVTVTWEWTTCAIMSMAARPSLGVPERQAPFSIVTPDNDYWVDAPKGAMACPRPARRPWCSSSYPGGLWHPYWYVRAKDPHTLIDGFPHLSPRPLALEVSDLAALYRARLRRRNRCRKRR